MAKAKRKKPFNVKVFLSTVSGGRSVSDYRKKQKIFSRGRRGGLRFFRSDGKSQSLRRL